MQVRPVRVPNIEGEPESRHIHHRFAQPIQDVDVLVVLPPPERIKPERVDIKTFGYDRRNNETPLLSRAEQHTMYNDAAVIEYTTSVDAVYVFEDCSRLAEIIRFHDALEGRILLYTRLGR